MIMQCFLLVFVVLNLSSYSYLRPLVRAQTSGACPAVPRCWTHLPDVSPPYAATSHFALVRSVKGSYSGKSATGPEHRTELLPC